jgi:hypothetical protein
LFEAILKAPFPHYTTGTVENCYSAVTDLLLDRLPNVFGGWYQLESGDLDNVGVMDISLSTAIIKVSSR